MLYGNALGSNPFSAIARGVQSVAKTAYSAASNTRVQQAAAAAAQAYAPGQYATAMQYADRARGIVQAGVPAAAPMPAPAAPALAPPAPGDDGPAMAPVQKGNLLPMAIGGAGLLLVLILILKK